jgi:hypothetical protein
MPRYRPWHLKWQLPNRLVLHHTGIRHPLHHIAIPHLLRDLRDVVAIAPEILLIPSYEDLYTELGILCS